MGDCGFDYFNIVPNSLTLHAIELSRSEVEDSGSDRFTEVVVEASKLGQFAASPTLDLFGSVSVHFFNNEDEKHQVGLNVKYAQVPYFALKFSNESRSFFSAHWGLLVLLVVAVAFLFVVFVFIMKSSQGRGRGSDRGYSRPKEHMEMSTITTN